MGERSESNRQPEAYEAPALPLSYAPELFKAASWDRTSNLPLTRRLLYPLSYHGLCRMAHLSVRIGWALPTSVGFGSPYYPS